MDEQQRQVRAGLAYGVAAYLFWGISPIYYKLVIAFPPLVVLAHRVVWSVLLLALMLALQRRWRELAAAAGARRLLGVLLLTTVLISINWYTFIWAIGAGYLLQASLGYFVTPLVQVSLGMIFLRERLRAWQLVSLLLAAVGVANLTLAAGEIPWIALALAGSFSFYALLRKVARVTPLMGLTVETALMLPPALYIAWAHLARDMAEPGGPQWLGYALLPIAGVVTAVPLLWFANAAQRLRLATIGFLQYLAPTCQFLLAVFLYGEAFTSTHLLTFSCIWTALVIYSLDSLHGYRRAARAEEQRLREAAGTALVDL